MYADRNYINRCRIVKFDLKIIFSTAIIFICRVVYECTKKFVEKCFETKIIANPKIIARPHEKIANSTVTQNILMSKNSPRRAEHENTLFRIFTINYTIFIALRLLRGRTIPGAVESRVLILKLFFQRQ